EAGLHLVCTLRGWSGAKRPYVSVIARAGYLLPGLLLPGVVEIPGHGEELSDRGSTVEVGDVERPGIHGGVLLTKRRDVDPGDRHPVAFVEGDGRTVPEEADRAFIEDLEPEGRLPGLVEAYGADIEMQRLVLLPFVALVGGVRDDRMTSRLVVDPALDGGRDPFRGDVFEDLVARD